MCYFDIAIVLVFSFDFPMLIMVKDIPTCVFPVFGIDFYHKSIVTCFCDLVIATIATTKVYIIRDKIVLYHF
jgi:hypothetical protein